MLAVWTLMAFPAFALAEGKRPEALRPAPIVGLSAWQTTGHINGPGLEADTPLEQASHLWERQNGILMLRPDAPTGSYTIEWSIPHPANAVGITISARLSKNNANQANTLRVNADGYGWNTIVSNTRDRTWQEKSSVLWLPQSSAVPLRLQWTFTKPGIGGNWQVSLADLGVVPASHTEVENAVREFRKPLAAGLPELADPRSTKKAWNSRLEVKDGLMLKDGQPFFPIGYVFGTDERSLAQAVAMGCNAVHFDVGWSSISAPNSAPSRDFAAPLATIHNAAAWGMAAFPLLTGHYVPGWFSRQYPASAASPLGNDGKKTGSWFPYSIHYPPFRENIANFWKSAGTTLGTKPSVMALNLWNEPSYGGTWNRGDQFADYSAWSIENYRAFLRRKYPDLAALNQAHARTYANFESVAPPHAPDELGRAAWLDWMEYGQSAFAQFFDDERGIIQNAAPGVRLVNKKQTNQWDSSAASSGTNWHLMSRSEDIFGINAYVGSEFGARDIFEGARSYANGKPVVVFETNVMPPGVGTRTPDRVRGQFWSQVIGGANGIFIFSMAGNDKEHGLLSNHAVSPEARREYVRFTQTVAKHQRELSAPQVKAKVAVLYSTTAALQTVDTVNNTVPSHVLGAFDLLRNSHYEVDILPEERCTASELDKYQLLVLPSYSILKPAESAVIKSWLARGGKVLAFGHSLEKNERYESIAPPEWLGIDTRQQPIGNRTEQRLSWIAPELQESLSGEISVSGTELISQLKANQSMLPGGAIHTEQSGQVLAYNADSYPAVLLNRNVIYCAFASRYSDELRGLMEGLVRNKFGLRQNVRLTDGGEVEPGIMTTLRQDHQDAKRRYLLLLNTLHRPRSLNIELGAGWNIVGEKFHGLKTRNARARLEAREVYLFELQSKG